MLTSIDQEFVVLRKDFIALKTYAEFFNLE